uniref:WW and C2 domain containing 1 n=1 Tax=Oryzias sinensis TaxID=183150 RepID=A0A8C7YRM6_9TELE
MDLSWTLAPSRSCGAVVPPPPASRPPSLACSRTIATIEVQIAKLDSEAWPGLLDPERDRLILINEKEELLKELQYVSPRQRLEPNDAERLESERKRLEKDLQAARDNQSKMTPKAPWSSCWATGSCLRDRFTCSLSPLPLPFRSHTCV